MENGANPRKLTNMQASARPWWRVAGRANVVVRAGANAAISRIIIGRCTMTTAVGIRVANLAVVGTQCATTQIKHCSK